MKNGSTLFLRLTVVALGLMALGLCILILPAIGSDWPKEYPDAPYLQWPTFVILSATVIPFFIALFQTWKLLDYVDKNTAFSERSVNALRIITYCALVFSALYASMLPIIHYITQKEDAPGLLVIGLIMTCAPIVIAVFSAVLQKLLHSAITMKNENDLTV